VDKLQLSLRAPFHREAITTSSALVGPVARFPLAGSFEAQGVARVQKYKSPKVLLPKTLVMFSLATTISHTSL